MSAPTSEETRVSAFRHELKLLYFLSLLCGVAVGLFNPLVSVFLEERGLGSSTIGANASLFFVCIALAAPLVARALRTLGIRRTLCLGFLVTGSAAFLFPAVEGVAAWFAVRAVMGLGTAFYMIGGQTAVNRFAGNANRAVVNGIYGLAFAVGLASGPLLGPSLYAVSPQLAFSVGGCVVLLGIVVTGAGLPSDRAAVTRARRGLVGRLSLPLHAVLAYGFAEATLLAVYPVFLLRRELSPEQCGLALSAFVVGGMLSTLPVTHLGDRFGHRCLLSHCAAVGSVAAFALMVTEGFGPGLVWSFVAGASLGPVFALALSLVGESLPAEDLGAGAALFTAAFSVGSTLGPWLSAMAMEALDDAHLFTLTIALFVALFLRISAQALRRPAPVLPGAGVAG